MAAPFTNDPARIQAALRDMQTVAATPRDFLHVEPFADPRVPGELFLNRVVSAADAMAYIRGRKVLFLFTYGFFGGPPGSGSGFRRELRRSPAGPMAEPMKRALDDCNGDDVAVYSFIHEPEFGGLGGNYYDRPDNPSEDHGGRTDFVRDLAVGTGGKYIPYGDYNLSSYLGSIAAAQSDYYLLGYTPAADSAGRPCHKLKVKVGRGGLEVTARDSYCTSGQPSARALKSAEKALESRPVAGLPAPACNSPGFIPSPERPSWISPWIPPSRQAVQPAGRRVSGRSIRGDAPGRHGEAGCRFSGPLIIIRNNSISLQAVTASA